MNPWGEIMSSELPFAAGEPVPEVFRVTGNVVNASSLVWWNRSTPVAWRAMQDESVLVGS